MKVHTIGMLNYTTRQQIIYGHCIFFNNEKIIENRSIYNFYTNYFLRR